jgi:plastocyanin
MKKSRRMYTKTIATIAISVLLVGIVSSSLMNDASAAYSTSKPSTKKPAAAKAAAKPTETKVTITKSSSTPGCEKKSECYKPSSVKIKTGGKVTWTNGDTAAHTVTSGKDATSDGTFDSGLIQAKKTFSYTFSKTGKYDYFCMVHPWMKGQVTVA